MSLNGKRIAVTMTAGASLAAVVAGCGDTITANRDFRSLNALVTVTEPVSNGTVNGAVLLGKLIDAQGRILPTTVVRETCARLKTSGSSPTAFRCLAVVNTGDRVNVAAGTADGPFGTLASLASPSSPASITFTKLSGQQPASKPLLVKISTATG